MELNMDLEFIPMHLQDKNIKDSGKMMYGMEKVPIQLEIQIKLESLGDGKEAL